MGEKLIFEKRSANDAGWLPALTHGEETILANLPEAQRRRREAAFPTLSELDVVRHYTRLSQKNFCVDTNFYPLGSCTMKYNPKALDSIASSTSFSQIHPYQSEDDVQGALEVLCEMQACLSAITGMDEFTLQPAAGAHGEFCGLLMTAAYHRAKGDKGRTQVLIPDSAHGTNPASAALCGYGVIQVRTNAKGHVDTADLGAKLGAHTACLMMTNPNTLGLFEEEILGIAKAVHGAGGLLYYDGANMNALTGICRPGDMGFDIVHLNLHKTFAVPHGSGGPGSGPVGVKQALIPFLPNPRIVQKAGRYAYENSTRSIGKLRTYYGNFGAIIRSYAYIRALGAEGLRAMAENSILNANYLKKRLSGVFDTPFDGFCMHEFVVSASRQKARGVKALDIAKRLLDFGVHAPTVYFPLIVEEAMMIEPTETESKETLDEFVRVLAEIDAEITQDPEKVRQAPHTTPVRLIDEVKAARELNLRYKKC